MSAPAAPRIPAGDKGTADRIEADEGAYWVRLVTRQALDREGAAMGHCLGDGGYDCLVGGEEIYDDSIWSLRRADGVSILTVRVQEHEVDYARGPLNHEPGRGAAMQLRHLVAGYTERSFQQLDIDEDTGITLVSDGRTFRLDRLPPDVAAAREASQAARLALQETRRVRALERDFDRIVMQEPVERVEICTDENPRRPRIRTIAPIFGDPIMILFDALMRSTASEPDPVILWVRRYEPGVMHFRTQSGITFQMPGPDIMLPMGQLEPALRQAFLDRYRAAITPPATLPEVRGVQFEKAIGFAEAECWYVLHTADKSFACGARDVEVLAGGVPMDPSLYVLDAAAGMVMIHADTPAVTIRYRHGDEPAAKLAEAA